MTIFPQFSNDPYYNSLAYIKARDQLTAAFENYSLFMGRPSGGLLFYDSAGLNIGFGCNITGNLATARLDLISADA